MTPLPPAPGTPSGPPPADAPLDALTLDRVLDGEGSPAEEARLAAACDRDPALRLRVESRRAFLAALSGARWSPGGVEPERLRALEARVRAALGAPAAPGRGLWRRARPLLAGAAVLVAGLSLWIGGSRTPVEAFDPVAKAAEVLRWQPRAFDNLGTCAGQPGSDVHAFALVRGGELLITGCAAPSDGGASVAVLHRPEQLPVLGYVAVPADAKARSGEVGLTEVDGGRTVVFDVLDHGRRVYLAVDPQLLRRGEPDPEHRWSCAACHGPARQALPNPHRIVLRRAP